MNLKSDLKMFFNPKSVAVIGATERPDSWGSIIMRSLQSRNYPGRVYAVNRHAKTVFGMAAFKDVGEIPGPIELAVFTIPEQSVEETIAACGRKQVKGIVIITAGFGETSEAGHAREEDLVKLARSFGIRLLGPNVSGTYNLHADFMAAGARILSPLSSPLAAISQGGFAFHDLIASGAARGLGVGKFVHTGNECDLTVTDFLEYFGDDPEVKAILMYLETIRDGRRFIDIARRVAEKKPVVVYKAGRTPGGDRAARSHTGALAGNNEIYTGLLHQLGMIVSPTMELLLPLGYALFERPVMSGRRVAIFTMGGSWGVVLSDFLEEAGLLVPELSPELQKRLKSFGMPDRASIKNPIDIGAISGPIPPSETILAFGREILSSGEVDALVFHGLGRPGMIDKSDPGKPPSYLDIEKKTIRAFSELEKETGVPVLIGNHYTRWESQVLSDLHEEGIRTYDHIDEITHILSRMYRYGKRRREAAGCKG
jgi:acetate---CoA ligase (ADP-forming) subunit alpha